MWEWDVIFRPQVAYTYIQYMYDILRVKSIDLHCESEKNWATFIFTVTLANVGRF